MVSQRDKKAINQLKEDIEYFENLSEISSTRDKEQYKKIVNEYKIQLQSLESKIEKHKPKKVNYAYQKNISFSPLTPFCTLNTSVIPVIFKVTNPNFPRIITLHCVCLVGNIHLNSHHRYRHTRTFYWWLHYCRVHYREM